MKKKLVGIVGSAAEKSHNRMLLQYIQKWYGPLFDLDIIEIKDVPLFNQSNDQTNSPVIQGIARRIRKADGVIISTPEHNHTIPSALKSVIEWLSFNIHPLANKPVMIIGASWFSQGSSRAQVHLRKILEAPGVNALTMPGNEFLLGSVKDAFDEEGDLNNQRTIDFLTLCLENFLKFIDAVEVLEEPEKLPEEDLMATQPIDTTIDVDMNADDWVEQAAEKVQACEGDDYVKLDRGVLTVNQLNYLLNSLPLEITYADYNNQYLYYNHHKDASDMLAPRTPESVGSPLGVVHPDRAQAGAASVVQKLRSGQEDVVRMHIKKDYPEKYIVHNYQAMYDENGAYMGINEYIHDLKPIIDWYLAQTGQKLVDDPNADAVTGASTQASPKLEATAKPAAKVETDTTSSASQK
ncbi:NAD(P)H-dependent oxidoreductase [Hutsoniella sourekii]